MMPLGTSAYVQQDDMTLPKEYSFVINEFTGGLNNVSNLEYNQASDLLNCNFSDGVSVQKRTGIMNTKLITITDTDKKITFIDEYKPYTGANKLIVATNSAVYSDGVKIKDVLGKVQGVTFRNKYYFVDGTYIYVYDGTNCKILKDPPVGFTPAPAPATFGVWNSNTTHVWYEPCQAELNDVYKGVCVIPLKPKYILANRERLYISGCADDPNNVYISDIENGYYWCVTLPIQPTPNGEKVVGIKVFMDVLIVAREESIYALYGNTNRADVSEEYFIMKRINTHTGVANGDTMTIVNNNMYYLGSDGVVYSMITPLTDVKILTTSVLSERINLYNKPIDLNIEDMTDSCASYYKENFYLKVKNQILVYNYRYNCWSIYKGFLPNCMTVLNGYRVFGMNDGKIYRHKIYDDTIVESDTQEKKDETLYAYSDYEGNDRVAISCYWYSKQMDMRKPTYYKFFRDVYVVTQASKYNNSDLSIKINVDYDSYDKNFEIPNRMSVFGYTNFGEKFISKEISQSLPNRLGMRGRVIIVGLENNILDNFMRVYEISGDYTLRGRR